MKNIFLISLFSCFLFACTSKEAATSAEESVTEQALACTRDLNEYGHPSQCQCPEEKTYDETQGVCK